MPFLSGRNILSFRDLSAYFYPTRHLMVEMAGSGQLPLWNPYLFCGYPLLATLQIGFFYPLSLIHYLLPFNLAFNYYIILHYFLAACFMFRLLRHFRLSRPASFLGGVVFAFSGYLLSVSNMNTSLSSVIWLPLVLLCFDRLLTNKSFLNIAGLALLLAIQFLGGEPTVIYVTLFFLLAYAAVFSRGFKGFVQNTAGLLLAGLIALGLAAVQLLPFLETALLSMRLTSTAYSFITYQSLPPRELINFLFPFFFGNTLESGRSLLVLFGDRLQAWLVSPYLGVLPLIIAVLSLKKGLRGRVAFFWGAALFSLFMAFGKYTPVHALFCRILPGVSLVRYPVKYLFLFAFSFAVLCGVGYEQVQDVITRGSKRISWGLVSGLGLLGLICLWVNANAAGIFHYFRSGLPTPFDPYYIGLLQNIVSVDIMSLNRLFLVLFFGLILWQLARLGRLGKTQFNCLMILLIIIDLAIANIAINRPAPSSLLKEATPNISVIKSDPGLFRYFSVPPSGREGDIRYQDYNEELYHLRDNLTPDRLLPDQIAALGGRESMEPKGFSALFWSRKQQLPQEHRKLLDLANVKYIFAYRYLRAPRLRLLRQKSVDNVAGCLYQNLDHLPRAFLVRKTRVIKDRQRIIEVLSSRDFDPRQEVIVEEELAYRAEPSRGKDLVEITGYSPNEILIDTFSDKSRVLFLSDTYYPGWQAYVDGKRARILRANYMFRAVILEKGKHEVRFVYSPLSFKLGALISTITLLGLVGLGGRLWRGRPARQRDTGRPEQNEASGG